MAAIAYTVVLFVSGLADNVLKPLTLGRGVDAPMPVILLGARWVAWRPLESWGCSSVPPFWRSAISSLCAGWRPTETSGKLRRKATRSWRAELRHTVLEQRESLNVALLRRTAHKLCDLRLSKV